MAGGVSPWVRMLLFNLVFCDDEVLLLGDSRMEPYVIVTDGHRYRILGPLDTCSESVDGAALSKMIGSCADGPGRLVSR